MYLFLNIRIYDIFNLKVWSPELFWNLIDLISKKLQEKYKLTSEENGRKNAQNDKTIIKGTVMQII